MDICIVGERCGLSAQFRQVDAVILDDPRYMLFYHDESRGIIVTDADAASIVARAREKKKPCLAIGTGILSMLQSSFQDSSVNRRLPMGHILATEDRPQTIILREGSRVQQWFHGTETIERHLACALDGAQAAKERLPLSGLTEQRHGAIYDLEPEDHPFFVGIAWIPEKTDPVLHAFLAAAQ